LNKFGPFYFGKDRAIRRKISEKLTPINLLDIDTQFETFVKKGKIKSQGKDAYEANFKGYKILSEGELTRKVTLTASAASKKAVEKVKKNGGELIVA
jgi:ribosomal protein L15